MKRTLAFVLLAAAGVACAESPDPLAYVDPFVGTGFHGHTYPGATTPYGMVQLSPDTRSGDWDACAGYYYEDTTLDGFSHTHLSGTGCADLADVLFRPTMRRAVTGEGVYAPEPYRFFPRPGACVVWLLCGDAARRGDRRRIDGYTPARESTATASTAKGSAAWRST